MSECQRTTEQISQDVLHFARRATLFRLHAAVLSVFVGRCQYCGFSLERLGELLGKPANDVGMILDDPETWTLDTVSDLLLAMQCEVNPQIREVLFSRETQNASQDQAKAQPA